MHASCGEKPLRHDGVGRGTATVLGGRRVTRISCSHGPARYVGNLHECHELGSQQITNLHIRGMDISFE